MKRDFCYHIWAWFDTPKYSGNCFAIPVSRQRFRKLARRITGRLDFGRHTGRIEWSTDYKVTQEMLSTLKVRNIKAVSLSLTVW